MLGRQSIQMLPGSNTGNCVYKVYNSFGETIIIIIIIIIM